MSLGLIPASSIARMQAVNCRERLLIPDLREYVVSPMPTIAALSLNSLVSYTCSSLWEPASESRAILQDAATGASTSEADRWRWRGGPIEPPEHRQTQDALRSGVA